VNILDAHFGNQLQVLNDCSILLFISEVTGQARSVSLESKLWPGLVENWTGLDDKVRDVRTSTKIYEHVTRNTESKRLKTTKEERKQKETIMANCGEVKTK